MRLIKRYFNLSYRLIMLPLAVLLLAVSLTSCIFSEPPEDLPADKSSEFHIESLTITPDAIMIGESATVIVTVSNSGDDEGVYTAVLLMEENEIEQKQVHIEPDKERSIEFTVTGESAGSYRLSVEKHSVILTIYNWVPHTIQYDSGTIGGSYYVAGNLAHIVHFTPQAKPFRIQKIQIYGSADLENPRELDTKQCTLRIWNSDKSKQLWNQNIPWRVFSGPIDWREIEVPDIIVEDDFYVELVTYSQKPEEVLTNYITIGWDKPKPEEGQTASTAETRSGVSDNGVLVTSPESIYRGINWFIRAEGEGAPLVLQYDDDGDEDWLWTTASYFVSFNPPANNFEVQKILIHGYVRTKDIDFLKEKTFTVRIRDQESGTVLWEQEYRWELFDLERAKWVEIKTPGIVCPGDFYVRLIPNSIDEENCIVIGVDSSNPNRHSYISRDVLIKPGESITETGTDYDSETANWMIRVKGVYR
ncbi:MAG: hypothetical protein P8105_07815 [Dehalococcoidia bacterium]